MRKSLILIFVAVIGSLLTHFLMQDRGYVMINFRGTTIETSVPGLLIVLALLYLLVRFAIKLFRAPRKFGQAVSQQRQSRARRKLNRGLIEMAEGNWKKGEAMLAQGAKSGDMPLLNYLNAARAAQLQGEHERRDNWLMLAYEQDDDASTAVLLTQADLQMDYEQYEEALATLRKVEDSNPGHLHAQIMMGAIYEKLHDYGSLNALLPKLKKIKKSPALDEVNRLIQVANLQQIKEAGIAKDIGLVNNLWTGLTAKMRKKPILISQYAQALCDCGAHDDAEKIIKKNLASQWDNDLVRAYGKLECGNTKKQLATAEGWLKNHADDTTLLITAARAAMRCESWGKARSYLESSIAIEPQAHAYQLYGELLTRLGEHDNAAAAFRQGLTLMTGGVTLTPALTGPDQKDADDAASTEPSESTPTTDG